MKQFRPATKQFSYLRLALIGPAGSGKTYSSLRIATALGARVAVIDSERGSASKYADEFAFDVLELETFAPHEYIEAIRAAVAGGYDVLIIDSLSHAWAGKGGVLDMHDAATAQERGGNSYTAWRTVSPEHNKLIEEILHAPVHIIATLRSKIAYVQEKDERGKTVVRKVGMQPIQREGLDFEFDVVGDLDQTNRLVITKTRCRALAQAIIPRPGAELAQTLQTWLGDNKPAPMTADQGQRLAQAMQAQGWDAAQLLAFINQTLGTTYPSVRALSSADYDRLMAAWPAAHVS
ncbi:ATP-binding protein [Sulfobacillus sp. hq2]|uniref:ATP-binding protein n=1 Tax=Sulfobacillus sp. hq2 TaxID=2039167 RepID=UPI000CD276CA|nr:ATP-binding protein [Sulfobacillus sp. hq2]POB12216.1 AAA family ATPase [Sulfobacillus sp. hq2]